MSAQQQPAQPLAQPPVQTNFRPYPGDLENYKAVTADRLKKPEDSDWLMVRRSYDGWATAARSDHDEERGKAPSGLESLPGVVSGHEAPPLVNKGVMFVATPSNQLLPSRRNRKDPVAIQAAGARGALVPHLTSRGVALYGDKVFFALGEAVLVPST